MSLLLQIVLAVLLSVTAIFLILLVLIQRGRGGGLAGAFGGAGGQSAFGTKAGDLFTRITIGVAAFWLILCAVSDKLLSSPGPGITSGLGKQVTAPVLPPGAGAAPGADSGATPASEKDAAPLQQGAAGPTTITPDATAPAEAAKSIQEATSPSLPAGSIGPNGALVPQQPVAPPASTEPPPTAPTASAPTGEPAAPVSSPAAESK